MKFVKNSLVSVLDFLSKVPNEVWTFVAGVFVFGFAFDWVNSDVDQRSVLDGIRVVMGNIVLVVVAWQTMPGLFFDMFDKK